MIRRIKKFLISCSGANPDILFRKGFSNERNKYYSLGAFVLFSATLGFLTASYTTYSIISQPSPLESSISRQNSLQKQPNQIGQGDMFGLLTSIIFGLLYGGIIFSFDRYLVVNIRTKKDYKWEDYLLRDIITFMLRIILAAILATVIAKSIEVFLFNTEINNKIFDNRKNEKITILNTRNSELKQIEEQINIIQEKITKKEKDNKNFEVWGTRYTSESGYKERKRKNEEELNLLRTDLTQENNKKNVLEQQAEEQAKNRHTDGFLAKIAVLEEIGDKNTKIGYINLFIFVFFIVLDLLPVLVKSIYGSNLIDQNRYTLYDSTIESEEESARDIQKTHAQNLKEEVEQELKSKQELREQIADIQHKLLNIEKESFLHQQTIKTQDKQEGIEQELKNNQNIREKDSQFLDYQLEQLLQKTLEDPELSKSLERVVPELIEKIESRFLEHIRESNLADYEISKVIKKASKTVLQKLNKTITESSIDNNQELTNHEIRPPQEVRKDDVSASNRISPTSDVDFLRKAREVGKRYPLPNNDNR